MTAPDSQLDTIEKDSVGQMSTTQAIQGFHTLHLFDGSMVSYTDLLRALCTWTETQSRAAFLVLFHSFTYLWYTRMLRLI